MSHGSDRLSDLRAAINVTPLVDVLLVLLIIFIMVAPILTQAVPTDIPRPADPAADSEPDSEQLVLQVAADGALRLNREPVAASALPQRLEAIYMDRPGRAVIFLDANEQVRYETVIAVIDLCRDGGAKVIGVVPDSVISSTP